MRQIKVILSAILNDISKITSLLQNIRDNQNRIINRLSALNNSQNRPFAYLDPDDQQKADNLREQNPELYGYIVEVLKLFVNWYDYTNNGN